MEKGKVWIMPHWSSIVKSCILGSLFLVLWGRQQQFSVIAQDHLPVDAQITEGHRPNIRLDRNIVQDKDHIMEHLDGVIDKTESEMTPQELQLHYFKMHDYDGNNLLDGLELISAIAHVYKEEGGHGNPLSEKDIVDLIDDVLRDDDKNNDGYIDYAEFAKSLE